jgi:hypothetical protein
MCVCNGEKHMNLVSNLCVLLPSEWGWMGICKNTFVEQVFVVLLLVAFVTLVIWAVFGQRKGCSEWRTISPAEYTRMFGDKPTLRSVK